MRRKRNRVPKRDVTLKAIPFITVATGSHNFRRQWICKGSGCQKYKYPALTHYLMPGARISCLEPSLSYNKSVQRHHFGTLQTLLSGNFHPTKLSTFRVEEYTIPWSQVLWAQKGCREIGPDSGICPPTDLSLCLYIPGKRQIKGIV